MAYRCRSCGTRFELPAGERLRCPNCLRTLGLEPETGASPAALETPPRSRGRALGLVLGLLAVVGVGAAVVLWYQQARPFDASSSGDRPDLGPAEQARVLGQARRLVAEARELFTAGKLREANAKADLAFGLAPALGEVRQLRGEIYRASGAFAEAVPEFVAALAAGETGERHLLAGEALAATGEPIRAEQHLQRARALDPQDAPPAVALAIFYQVTGQEAKLAALRAELRAGTDGGASPLDEQVAEALTALEQRRAARLAELQQRLAAPPAGAPAGAPEAAAPASPASPSPAPASPAPASGETP
ncbi:MAG: hypothetical protein RBU45_17265 [Myxococcota bacterium]|jgi:tetratricopeptide (TPR) repeat protein|nr:hypothetical protein [Myxococcota bacterium]